LHDVGKVSPGFQQKCEKWRVQYGFRDRALSEGWNPCESDHAKVSQFTVQALLSGERLHAWAAMVGAHHGCIKGERVQVGGAWEGQRRRLAEELIKEFGPLPINEADDATLWLVAGLITVADWIGSDESRFPQQMRGNLAERLSRATQAVADLGWNSFSIRTNLRFEDLFAS